MTCTPTIITLHGTNVARSKGVEVKGRGMAGPIGPLARKLIKQRLARPFDDVAIYRGDTLCFNPAPLIWWATMHTSERFGQSGRTAVYVPRPDLDASP